MATMLITGGTGFVGSHVAEEAVRRGDSVRCLVRPGSDTAFLQTLGVQLVSGDLTSAEAVQRALDGVDVVVHAAAKVGDWGHVDEFRRVNVEGLRHLLDAAAGRPIRRIVHVSSLGVYEARHHFGTTEAEPLPAEHIDGYTQSKVEAETLALERHRNAGLPIAIVRPGFIYGSRDRSVLPRIAERLKKGSIILIARGQYALNTTYVGNLVDAIFLAAEKPEAIGEVFNITDGEFVSKRRFFETIADGLKLPRPKRNIPLFLGKFLAKWRENVFRKKNKPFPPLITQASLKFAGLNLDFSIAKARTMLGYEPRTPFREGMKSALDWYRTTQTTAGG